MFNCYFPYLLMYLWKMNVLESSLDPGQKELNSNVEAIMKVYLEI